MKRLLPVILTVSLLSACGGNYSNEDLEFQAALPERDELTVKMPNQNIVIAGSAEYYTDTRNVVRLCNGLTTLLLGLIDHVRTYSPSERKPDVRIWGPFDDDKRRGWETRMEMRKVADPAIPTFGYRFEYEVSAQRKRSIAGWIPLIKGSFSPNGGARKGLGTIVYTVVQARAGGYPADEGEDREFQSVEIRYQTLQFPVTIDLVVKNVDTAKNPMATYSYTEAMDGSGSMAFLVRANNPLAEAYQLRARWTSSGAGRGDARITEGLLAGRKGTDCWGMDTRPTFVFREGEPTKSFGTEASCLFAAP